MYFICLKYHKPRLWLKTNSSFVNLNTHWNNKSDEFFSYCMNLDYVNGLVPNKVSYGRSQCMCTKLNMEGYNICISIFDTGNNSNNILLWLSWWDSLTIHSSVWVCPWDTKKKACDIGIQILWNPTIVGKWAPRIQNKYSTSIAMK